MGQWIPLDTPAGRVAAWLAEPAGAARGGLVVVQEIFGANAHIRAVAEGYAADGYVVLAPAFFDPVEPGVELDYDPAGTARGRELVAQLGLDAALQIVAAAAAWLQARLAGRGEPNAVGTVGYCWGGTVALLAATRLGLPAVSYYGARTVPFIAEAARAALMFHFGGRDASIPADDIARHRALQPHAGIFVYPNAGHAFNRDVDPAHFHADGAALAQRRTLAFLAEHTS